MKLYLASLVTLVASLSGCSEKLGSVPSTSTFAVIVTKVNGADPPTADAPLPANHGEKKESWAFTIEARGPAGESDSFNGVVRLSTQPGALLSLTGDGATGRNLLVKDGKAAGVASVTAVYGPSRLWVEDIGYVPAPPGATPACSDGKNNDPDEDVLVDFPADPGCAYADDDTETGGTYAAGVSQPVEYALPKISDIQGRAAKTPYPYESMQVDVPSEKALVVTRVSNDGFFVTDTTDQATGYNHLFAFNFSTPSGMRVCDYVEYLSGTVNEFFGFTELNFPSYSLAFPVEGKDTCSVPEPAVIFDPNAMPPINLINQSTKMEAQESGLVRIRQFKMPTKFGPGVVVNNSPKADASSCDLNGDGQVDFASDNEGGCASACEADPECSEWTTFSARSEIKVHNGSRMIQIDLSTVSGFDPQANKGVLLDSVTGTLRNFSGGSLNWTVQARCGDDLACTDGTGCVAAPIASDKACVRLRTDTDNDQGTN